MFNALTGYVMGGLGVIILALGGYTMWQRGDLAEARAQAAAAQSALNIALDANKAQEAAIARLKQQDQVNQQSAVDLQAAVVTVQDQSRKMDEAIAKLDKASTDVHTFLNAAVPADLRCLLAHKPAGCHLN